MDHHDQPSNQEVQYVHPHSHWMDNTGYPPQHQSPVSEYHPYAFSAPHVPMEPHYAAPLAGSRMNSYPHLQPLVVPPWPSMLANQPHYPATVAAQQAPAHTHPPAIQPVQSTQALRPQTQLAPAAPLVPHASVPRKTLTDADRRRMCIYHEENPTKKQTEIGDLFGVERSTVSKVLRQKEKYLYRDDGSRSPVRRSKGKFPDVERALSNWVKNQEVKGAPLTDELIRDQARFFCTTVGGNDSQLKINSAAWLEKFKQKHNLMGSARSRKNSEAVSDAGDGHFGGLSSPPVCKSSPHIPSPTSNGERMIHSASPYNAQNSFGDSRSAADSSASPLFTPDSADAPGSAFFGNDGVPRSRSSSHYISPPPSSKAATPKFASANPAVAAATSSPNGSSSRGSKNKSNSKKHMPPPAQPATAAANRHQSPNSPAVSPSTVATATTVSPVTPSSATMQHHRQFLNTTSPMSGNLSREDARKALEIVMTYFQQQQFYQHQQQQQQHQNNHHRQGLAISTSSAGGSPLSSSSPTFSSASSATSAAGPSANGGSVNGGGAEMMLTMDQEEFHAMGKLMNKLRLHQQQQQQQLDNNTSGSHIHRYLHQHYPPSHHHHHGSTATVMGMPCLKKDHYMDDNNNDNDDDNGSGASLPGGMHRIPQVEFGGGDTGSSSTTATASS